MIDTRPAWMKQGFRRHGPRRIRCRCGVVISSNCWARASHLRGKEHAVWEVRQAAERDRMRLRMRGGL